MDKEGGDGAGNDYGDSVKKSSVFTVKVCYLDIACASLIELVLA